MRKDCPCHHCTERFPNCHDVCERYKTWSKEGSDRNALISHGRAEENMFIDVTIKSIKRHRGRDKK